jgi:hypothetical protein
VTVDIWRGSKLILFENVPVGVCTRCGERYYPGLVLEHLQALAARPRHRRRTLRVPVLDFASVA